jgi:hypothetical protein
VNFRAYPLSPSAADYRFRVEVTSATLGLLAEQIIDNAALPSLRPQQRATSTGFEVICANGAAIGPAEWGMSDALSLSDMIKTQPTSFALPAFNAVAGTIYTVTIYVDRDFDFHVVGLYIGEN